MSTLLVATGIHNVLLIFQPLVVLIKTALLSQQIFRAVRRTKLDFALNDRTAPPNLGGAVAL